MVCAIGVDLSEGSTNATMTHDEAHRQSEAMTTNGNSSAYVIYPSIHCAAIAKRQASLQVQLMCIT